jgi:hypothetical protein
MSNIFTYYLCFDIQYLYQIFLLACVLAL